MSYELSKDDKINIINQHLRNLEYSRYNLEMTILEEKALAVPNKSILENTEKDMNEIVAKQNILLLELEKVDK